MQVFTMSDFVHQITMLFAFLLLPLLPHSFAARIPILLCNPHSSQLQLHTDSNCTTWTPPSSLNLTSSSDLKPMPIDKSDSGFPFHMTDSTIGFNFTEYRFTFPLPNDQVELLIVDAARKVHDDIAKNPRLSRRALTEWAEFIDPTEEFALALRPDTSVSMTWRDVEDLWPILAVWAGEYEAKECEFEIWRWPGTERKQTLGVGSFVCLL